MKKTFTVIDVEADALLDTISKIHCLSYAIIEHGKVISRGSFIHYDDMITLLLEQEVIVGHNIISYDIPALEKILGITILSECIDTLGLSWCLAPLRARNHSLEAWGVTFGIKKKEITDWNSLPVKEYVERCEIDVDINTRLFLSQLSILDELYDSQYMEFVRYVTFKMVCLRDQEQEGILLDKYLCEKTKLHLESEMIQKITKLQSAMPHTLGTLTKTKPSVMYKKDGTLSESGHNWFNTLSALSLSPDTQEIRELPNPTSPDQLKEWLFSLGWVPKTYKLSKSTGEQIPQVTLPFGAGICPSVIALIEKEPIIKELEDLYVIRHRIGLFKSFLQSVDKKGKVYCKAHGFTNTMRLQHSKPLANLPGVSKPYGKEIRGCLIAPKGYTMCGGDISGLEDNTKQHYIYYFDAEYVKEMRVPGFDPHLDIGVLAGLITEEESDFYKWYDNLLDEEKATQSPENKQKFKVIKGKRFTSKTTNFSCVYGAGPPKIAETANISLSEGKRLHQIYWQRNKAVKLTANALTTKKVNGLMWLYNPVSKFWYYLKTEKDKFSTLNQGTGCYVFDLWLSKVKSKLRKLEIAVPFQYHDELFTVFPDSIPREQIREILYLAIQETNTELQLNVEIGISVVFGNCYSDCH